MPQSILEIYGMHVTLFFIPKYNYGGSELHIGILLYYAWYRFTFETDT